MSRKHKSSKPPAPPAAESDWSWRLPRSWAAALALAWGAAVLSAYVASRKAWHPGLGPIADALRPDLWRLPNPYLRVCLEALGAVLLVVGAAAGLGRVLLAFLIGPALSRLDAGERFVLGAVLGLGVLGTCVLGLGALGLWSPAAFGALCGASCLAWLAPAGPAPAPRPAAREGIGTRLGLAALALLLAAAAWTELTPEIFYDALVYHLGIPDLYRLHHGLEPLPTHIFSSSVLLIQHLWGLVLTLAPGPAPKLLHGALAVLLAAAMLAFGRRRLSPGAGVLSALFFLSAPAAAANLGSSGIDVAWSLFQFAAAWALIQALEDPAWWAAAGLLAGFCAACRYQSFPVILIGALVAWRSEKDRGVPSTFLGKPLAVYAGAALLALSPWLIRNAAYHGNPVYPFGGLFWGRPRVEQEVWDRFLSDAYVYSPAQAVRSLADFGAFLAHPWQVTMGNGAFEELIGPLWLMLLPLAILAKPRSGALSVLRRYALLLWLLWACTSRNARFLANALVLSAPLMAELLIETAGSWAGRGLALLSAAACLHGATISLTVSALKGGWPVVEGSLEPAAYLREAHISAPVPPYAAIEWMNAHLPAKAKVMFVAEGRTYGIERDVLPASIIDLQPLVRIAQASKDGADLARRLREAGVTHLFFNFGSALGTNAYGHLDFDGRTWKVFEDFWAHSVRSLWHKLDTAPDGKKLINALYVYELTSESDSLQPHPPPPNPFIRWRPKS